MVLPIQLKRTSGTIASKATILKAGEALYSLQDKQLVIGDGTTRAQNLPRFYSKTWLGDIIDIEHGGTGNSSGYIRTGAASGSTFGVDATAEGNSTVADGNYSHAEGLMTSAHGNFGSHAEGSGTSAQASASHAEGGSSQVQTTGQYGHAEGYQTSVEGIAAHAEGNQTNALGNASHASGTGTVAEGRSQFVIGEYNIIENATPSNRGIYIEIVGKGASDASRSNARTLDWQGNEWISGKFSADGGLNSYVIAGRRGNFQLGSKATVEGDDNVAEGNYSHAEGLSNESIGTASHSEGYFTVAGGNYSHAEGQRSISQGRSQHVFGEDNIVDNYSTNPSDKGRYVEIVGNGEEGRRSNARTLDWNGHEWLQDTLSVGRDPQIDLEVATKRYVDQAIAAALASL